VITSMSSMYTNGSIPTTAHSQFIMEHHRLNAPVKQHSIPDIVLTGTSLTSSLPSPHCLALPRETVKPLIIDSTWSGVLPTLALCLFAQVTRLETLLRTCVINRHPLCGTAGYSLRDCYTAACLLQVPMMEWEATSPRSYLNQCQTLLITICLDLMNTSKLI